MRRRRRAPRFHHQLRLLSRNKLPRQVGRLARETRRDYLLVFEAHWTLDQIDRVMRTQGPRLDRILLYKAMADEAEADAIAALHNKS